VKQNLSACGGMQLMDRMHLPVSSDTLFKNYFVHGIRKTTHFIAFLDTPWPFE
jgi:hypothetical protein